MNLTAVFVGMPASGKTTVGRLVARCLGEPFADTDTLIEAKAGMSIPAIFKERGEEGFRQLEAEVIREAVASRSGILALGGGALETPSTREALAGHRVILIDAEREVLLARLRRSTNDRPLMRGDTEANLDRLLAEREPLYRECATDVVRSDGTQARRVARRVLDILGAARHERLEAGNFDIIVGENLSLEAAIAATSATDIVLLTQDKPAPEEYRAALESAGRLVEGQIGRGSPVAEISEIRYLLEQEGIARSGMVFVFGDGDAQRLAAYATRTHGGGLAVVAVPTSVEAALCGAWEARHVGWSSWARYEPTEILCDLALIERADGDMAEALAQGFARDTSLMPVATAPSLDSTQLSQLLLGGLAARAEGPHAIQRDEEFHYGHTLAHAIMTLNPNIGHSHALGFGMLFAAGIAEALGLAEEGWQIQHAEALASAGLPIRLEGISREALERELKAQSRIDAPDAKMHRYTNRILIVPTSGEPRVINSVRGPALDAGFRAIGL